MEETMKALCVVMACVALTACGPTLVGSNPNTVMLGNTNWTNASDAFAMAERECQRYGKHARLSITDPWSYQQSYNCEI
jgi:hypothetical protein